MIKKLKMRFILIAMVSISIVLVAILGSINVLNYINVNKTANERLSLLADNKGDFSNIRREMATPEGKPFGEGNPASIGEFIPKDDFSARTPRGKIGSMSAETPFDTRFFTVSMDAQGNIISTNTESIAAISSEEASGYARSLWEKGKNSGFWGSYKFILVPDADEAGNSMYIFLDCQRELDTFFDFLFASIGISVIGLFLVFLLVIFFSGIVVRPMAESYEKQKRFITDASHEIKTPLTIIDANTEVLEMVHGESEWTKSIRNQIGRLTDLTNKLVFLSRMDEEATTLTMLDFSLSDALEETALPFEAVAASQGKRFTMEIAPHITYHGDEAAIRQAVSLLLDNAMKYSTDGSEITLSLISSGNNRTITVKNKASDLMVGNLDILFERFYRPDASRSSSTGGNGIGLSVAQAIILAHKGKITAKSPDGETIEFKITL